MKFTKYVFMLITSIACFQIPIMAQPELDKDQAPFTTTGLSNPSGCWCYRNATLQVLTHLISIDEPCNHLQMELQALQHQLIISSRAAVNPTSFYRNFKNLLATPDYSEYISLKKILISPHHEDASEFLLPLITMLTQNDPVLAKEFSFNTPNILRCSNCKNRIPSVPTLGPSQNILFLDPFGQTHQRSLKRLLQTTFASTTPNDYRCNSCQKANCSTLSIRLLGQPQFLTLALPRFVQGQNGTCQKETNSIKIPINIDLKPYFLLPSPSTHYTLRAVICHQGALNNGHYWAYIKNKNDNTWWKFNDASVTKINNISKLLNTSHPYLLFYEQQEPPRGFWARIKSFLGW